MSIDLSPDLIAAYAGPVPRYTSYPTAPHFTPAVGADTYAEWLAALDPEAACSLYLHVPFCHKLCWYCGCHTKVVNRYEPVAAYVELLLQEAGLVADALGRRQPVTYLHWGGGTPTILRPDDILAVTRVLRERFAFAPGAEVAVEIDPRGLRWETVAALGEAGVTRASIGVQDFDPHVQARVNRVQPYVVVERAVGLLRHAGIREINFDLMYGLPLQTAETMLETVETAVTLHPDQIALFGYAHVPWMKPHQKLIDEAELPDAAGRWEIASAAAARLADRGYVRVGLDHFARPESGLAAALRAGRLRRNFQGYTTDTAEALLGFGASAIGGLPQGYVQNEVDVPAYRRRVMAGELATARGVALTGDDRLRREIIERLMCHMEVDLDAVCRRHGRDIAALARELDSLESFVGDGLVRREGTRVTVEEAARPLVRSVCAVFDAYLDGGQGRHSAAV